VGREKRLAVGKGCGFERRKKKSTVTRGFRSPDRGALCRENPAAKKKIKGLPGGNNSPEGKKG